MQFTRDKRILVTFEFDCFFLLKCTSFFGRWHNFYSNLLTISLCLLHLDWTWLGTNLSSDIALLVRVLESVAVGHGFHSQWAYTTHLWSITTRSIVQKLLRTQAIYGPNYLGIPIKTTRAKSTGHPAYLLENIGSSNDRTRHVPVPSKR